MKRNLAFAAIITLNLIIVANMARYGNAQECGCCNGQRHHHDAGNTLEAGCPALQRYCNHSIKRVHHLDVCAFFSNGCRKNHPSLSGSPGAHVHRHAGICSICDRGNAQCPLFGKQRDPGDHDSWHGRWRCVQLPHHRSDSLKFGKGTDMLLGCKPIITTTTLLIAGGRGTQLEGCGMSSGVGAMLSPVTKSGTTIIWAGPAKPIASLSETGNTVTMDIPLRPRLQR